MKKLPKGGTIQMLARMRAVTVHQVPEQVTATEERSFLHDLQKDVETERPRLVLDCSRVQQMDNATIHLLLCSLEEVMKRNGDAKLASLPPGAQATLQLAGVNRLFEIYATTAEAVNSFRERPIGVTPPELAAGGFPRGSENVA
jgi:anti-anti-sigma factor